MSYQNSEGQRRSRRNGPAMEDPDGITSQSSMETTTMSNNNDTNDECLSHQEPSLQTVNDNGPDTHAFEDQDDLDQDLSYGSVHHSIDPYNVQHKRELSTVKNDLHSNQYTSDPPSEDENENFRDQVEELQMNMNDLKEDLAIMSSQFKTFQRKTEDENHRCRLEIKEQLLGIGNDLQNLLLNKFQEHASEMYKITLEEVRNQVKREATTQEQEVRNSEEAELTTPPKQSNRKPLEPPSQTPPREIVKKKDSLKSANLPAAKVAEREKMKSPDPPEEGGYNPVMKIPSRELPQATVIAEPVKKQEIELPDPQSLPMKEKEYVYMHMESAQATSIGQSRNSAFTSHTAPVLETETATTAITPIQVSYPPKEVKLTLPTYLKTTRYLEWKARCILAANNNPAFKTITITNEKGELEFNPAMSLLETRTLYLSTITALKGEAEQIVATEDSKRANGILLWRKLDKYFLKTHSSYLSHEKLRNDFKSLSKHPHESFIQYANRYNDKLEALQRHGINTPKHIEMVSQIIRNTKAVPEVFAWYLRDLDNATWHVGMTPRDVAEWCEEEIMKYGILNPGKKIYIHDNKKDPLPSKQSGGERTKGGRDNQTKESNKEVESHDKITESNKLQKKFNNSTNVIGDLYELYGRYRRYCPIHDKNHGLLECTTFRDICKACNIYNNFRSVQESLNIPEDPFASKKTGGTEKSNDAAAKKANQQKPKAKRVVGVENARSQSFDEEEQEYYAEDDGDYEEYQNNESNNTVNPYAYNSTETNSNTIIARTTIETKVKNALPQALKNIYKACVDSGATHTMSPIEELFEEITYIDKDDPNAPKAELGDEKTQVRVEGYGPMLVNIHGKIIRRMGLYIPELGQTTILSVKQHSSYEGCVFHAEANNTFLSFPEFVIWPRVDHEIDVLLRPVQKTAELKIDFDEYTAKMIEVKTPKETQDLFLMATRQQKMRMIELKKTEYIPKEQIPEEQLDTVAIKKLIPHAYVPSRATEGSIGYDVKAIARFTLQPGEITKIPTGLATELPQGMYLRIAPRSSMALRHLTIEGGVIDSDFRGDITVLIKNNAKEPYTIERGNKIAQFIFEKASTPCIEIKDTLGQTDRGNGAFGSTNKKITSHFTVKSYRVSANKVLYIDTKGSMPKVRRMAIPRIQKEPEEMLTPTNPIPDMGKPEKAEKRHHFQEILIQHHRVDEQENTPVDNVLQMKHREIPKGIEDKEQQPSQKLNEDSPTLEVINESPPAQLPVTKVNKAQPKHATISREFLSQSIGFRQPEPLIKHMTKLGNGSVRIQRLPRNPILDPGETATMKSKRRNKNESQRPKKFGEVMHMDIGFGPCSAIGGVRYTLMVVDKATRYKFIYPLKNLKHSLHSAIEQLITDCDNKIIKLRTDFDKKLIGGKTKKILSREQIKIEASPPYRQHENGLVERHWQTAVTMARNWLKSSLLPTKYWYFAIKRACEITNILPIRKKAGPENDVTTPFELVYKEKVDYRVLFPMFSVAYIKYMKVQHETHQVDYINRKWATDSLKCIVVESCPTSDGLLFYHPPSKKTFSCADGYKFDTFSPAGAQFNEKYDGNFVFSLKSDMEITHVTPSHEKNKIIFYKPDGEEKYLPARVITQPVDEDEDDYTIQMIKSDDIYQVKAEEMMEADPEAEIKNEQEIFPLPEYPWIKPQQMKVTLYLNDRMNKPKRGFLNRSAGKWYFTPGQSFKPNKSEILTTDNNELKSMIENKKLFQGWKSAKFVIAARRSRATSNLVAELLINRKVSAKGLIQKEAPASLLKHHQLHPQDREIWDESYRQEYQGLVDIDTWETITEQQYEEMKHLYKGIMPTMAISVIKYDGEGNPTRAKYRIVALGNLDPNHWEKTECFAPVLSQPELRLLVALAAKLKRVPKQGDITQAFCQSYLPEGENYVCRPPAGCPLTPKGLYWRLKKTLYGLKRSPRHFYDLCRKTLLKIGLKQHPTSPCIFSGTLIKGQPKLYLGLYVDDMIFFSASDEVERKFQYDFSQELDTTFNDNIDYFLGLQFTHKYHDDGNLTIKLSQTAFTENLLQTTGLSDDAINTVQTPYRSGFPVDSIPSKKMSKDEQDKLIHQMRVLCGSLNWLAQSTRPDIATITNILSRYVTTPTKQHIDQAKRVLKYLKGTKAYGISFTSRKQEKLASYIKFPIPEGKITALSDANWGPQDQSKPRENETRTYELFKSRSISGYLLWLGGPLHWLSKRQTITARSSAEAEIYATDECTKALLHFYYLLDGLDLTEDLMDTTTTIYNDNNACVQWARNTTTKGLRHIQIRENAVREAVQRKFIKVVHVNGKLNLSDMFTKEEKDANHFCECRDNVLTNEI